LFCPLSPEAYLLTGTSFIYYVMGNDSQIAPSPYEFARLAALQDMQGQVGLKRSYKRKKP
jgi:hypothetical protein